jgi:hypothetical protein
MQNKKVRDEILKHCGNNLEYLNFDILPSLDYLG